mgnify:FL=1
MAGISLKNVQKIYSGNVTAVHKFNLDIKDKEFVVLVGPSGCGKSTTLRMIAGLEDISEGELYIGDRLVNDVQPKDRNIAMVFQNYALYPHMTVFENMAFGLKLRKVPKDEIKRKVEEVAGILDITHLLNRKPKALSGGQRQRVALGRAMVRNPDVFLLDEPLSNLDAKLRTTMRSEIIKLHRRLDATFVYVTHDQTEAMTMGDRIVVMKDGHIQQVDTPQRLFNFPANVFVAGFIGSPQMNFINSKVVKYENKYFIEFSGSLMSVPQRFMDKIKDYENKEVIMGVRPEDIIIEEKSEVKASVDIMEVMGSEAYVYLKLNDGSKLIAKTGSGVNFNVGDEVGIKANPDKIHIFDKETEKSILL